MSEIIEVQLCCLQVGDGKIGALHHALDTVLDGFHGAVLGSWCWLLWLWINFFTPCSSHVFNMSLDGSQLRNIRRILANEADGQAGNCGNAQSEVRILLGWCVLWFREHINKL